MSVSVGKIFGVQIRIHYTWVFIFLLITWSLATGYMPSQFPGLETSVYWIIGIISAITLFISVLIHELAHSYVALRQGLNVPSITLFLFGGVSEILEEPENPKLEAKMAAIGPLSSFGIAVVFAILWFMASNLNLNTVIIAPLSYIAIINVLLGGFNLLPAFPLDGGRVLRAALWSWKKNLIKATSLSSKISSAIAYIMVGLGFVLMLFLDLFSGLWLIFIGWFLKNGAESSLKQTIISQALGNVSVQKIMNTDVKTVSPEMPISAIITDYFERFSHGGFPVVTDGQFLGKSKRHHDYKRQSDLCFS
ncbi:MAG: site-2 protease family protein [Candidatus Bathyarchaeota archaeon]